MQGKVSAPPLMAKSTTPQNQIIAANVRSTTPQQTVRPGQSNNFSNRNIQAGNNRPRSSLAAPSSQSSMGNMLTRLEKRQLNKSRQNILLKQSREGHDISAAAADFRLNQTQPLTSAVLAAGGVAKSNRSRESSPDFYEPIHQSARKKSVKSN